MSHVICTLPNAADEINGIPFKAHAKGKISVEKLSEDRAKAFASIPGYELADDVEAPAAGKGKAKAKAADAQVDASGDKPASDDAATA